MDIRPAFQRGARQRGPGSSTRKDCSRNDSGKSARKDRSRARWFEFHRKAVLTGRTRTDSVCLSAFSRYNVHVESQLCFLTLTPGIPECTGDREHVLLCSILSLSLFVLVPFFVYEIIAILQRSEQFPVIRTRSAITRETRAEFSSKGCPNCHEREQRAIPNTRPRSEIIVSLSLTEH